MPVTIYGASDDLIEVEGDVYEEFPAQMCGYKEDDFMGGYLALSDGSVFRVFYDSEGIWRIVPKTNKGNFTKHDATDPDDDYTDRVTVEGDIGWVVYGTAVGIA